MPTQDKIVGIVGPSKSGKSTLKRGLEAKGYTVKHIAQEHSFAPSMWKIIANPDVLIYLDISYKQTLLRGQPIWSEEDFDREFLRLEHARSHADCYISTDKISSDQVLDQALDFLNS